jgi:hypothetical protein
MTGKTRLENLETKRGMMARPALRRNPSKLRRSSCLATNVLHREELQVPFVIDVSYDVV